MEAALLEQVKLRPANNDDLNFILKSWLKSCRRSQQYRNCPSKLYFDKMTGLVTHLLSVKDTVVLCSTEHPSQILAWLCFERIDDPGINTVYFAYTKATFRNLGALRYLFAQCLGRDPTQYCIETQFSSAVAKQFGAIYNPFKLMR